MKSQSKETERTRGSLRRYERRQGAIARFNILPFKRWCGVAKEAVTCPLDEIEIYYKGYVARKKQEAVALGLMTAKEAGE